MKMPILKNVNKILVISGVVGVTYALFFLITASGCNHHDIPCNRHIDMLIIPIYPVLLIFSKREFMVNTINVGTVSFVFSVMVYFAGLGYLMDRFVKYIKHRKQQKLIFSS